MPLERLQKIIARAGVASRREAEELIREGRVTINGQIVRELGTRADSEKDHIKVDGKLLKPPQELRYILLNKPREVMTTTSDPEGRTTVLDLLKGVKERVFPVGRLDYQSEGLLLLTNDGDLAFRVSHPSSGSVKTYHVKVRGVPPGATIEKLQRGVVLDGKRTLPCEIRPLRTTGARNDEGNSWWEVRLREGRTNQIRLMFQYQGHPVSKLRRVAIGALSDAKLPVGEWRELDRQELRLLTREAEPPAPRRQRRSSSAGKAGAAPRKGSARKAGGGTRSSGGAKKRASGARTGSGTRKGPTRSGAPSKTGSAASSTRSRPRAGATGSSRKGTAGGKGRGSGGRGRTRR